MLGQQRARRCKESWPRHKGTDHTVGAAMTSVGHVRLTAGGRPSMGKRHAQLSPYISRGLFNPLRCRILAHPLSPAPGESPHLVGRGAYCRYCLCILTAVAVTAPGCLEVPTQSACQPRARHEQASPRLAWPVLRLQKVGVRARARPMGGRGWVGQRCLGIRKPAMIGPLNGHQTGERLQCGLLDGPVPCLGAARPRKRTTLQCAAARLTPRRPLPTPPSHVPLRSL